MNEIARKWDFNDGQKKKRKKKTTKPKPTKQTHTKKKQQKENPQKTTLKSLSRVYIPGLSFRQMPVAPLSIAATSVRGRSTRQGAARPSRRGCRVKATAHLHRAFRQRRPRGTARLSAARGGAGAHRRFQPVSIGRGEAGTKGVLGGGRPSTWGWGRAYGVFIRRFSFFFFVVLFFIWILWVCFSKKVISEKLLRGFPRGATPWTEER